MNVRSLAVLGLGVALFAATRNALAAQVQQLGELTSLDEFTGASGIDEYASEDSLVPDDEQTNIFQDAMNTVRNAVSGNDIAEVIESGAGYIVVRRPSGEVQRLRGSRNWRNNNPGNIEYGSYARSMGAVGTDGRFAVFPSYEAGRTAKEKLIFEGAGYRGLSLSQAINRYAPPVENDTQAYQRTVLQSVGGVDKTMADYSDYERSRILAAMERMEGFKAGTVTTVA